MGKKKELFLAAILFASTCVGSALAGTSQDSQLLSSTQTYKLVPGTSTYNAWARWISDELNKDPNLANFENGAPSKKHFDIPTNDDITIQVLIPPSSDRFVTISPDGTAPAGPPTPLPATGTPGEQITIVDATRTYYASWTYQWVGGGGGGGGGWDLIGSSYHDCGDSSDKPEGVRCQPL